jgi:hypothetical protein
MEREESFANNIKMLSKLLYALVTTFRHNYKMEIHTLFKSLKSKPGTSASHL